jgi:hypothetical protein
LLDNSKKMLAAHLDDNMVDRWVQRGVPSDPLSSPGRDVSLITARSASGLERRASTGGRTPAVVAIKALAEPPSLRPSGQ